jgi:hypothetical protein
MVNREQIVTLLEVAASAGNGLERQAGGSA